MIMIFMMMCSGVSLRCTLSVVPETMKMSKVVLLMKMMIVVNDDDFYDGV